MSVDEKITYFESLLNNDGHKKLTPSTTELYRQEINRLKRLKKEDRDDDLVIRY